MKKLVGLLLLCLASPVWGQDVALEINGDVAKVKVSKLIEIFEDRQVVKKLPFQLKAPEGGALYSWDVPATFATKKRGNVLDVTAAPNGYVTISAEWVVLEWDGKTQPKLVSKFATLSFNVGDVGPIPPPIPPPDPKPVPPPPDPKPVPVPVTSFRVIFVAESGKTLTAQQNSVIAGKAVRDWLTTNTTPEGAFAGWRHYDPQQTVANELPNMKKLWEAVQPKLSELPCVVIERNGLAEIIPLAATPAEMVEQFKKYKGT